MQSIAGISGHRVHGIELGEDRKRGATTHALPVFARQKLNMFGR